MNQSAVIARKSTEEPGVDPKKRTVSFSSDRARLEKLLELEKESEHYQIEDARLKFDAKNLGQQLDTLLELGVQEGSQVSLSFSDRRTGRAGRLEIRKMSLDSLGASYQGKKGFLVRESGTSSDAFVVSETGGVIGTLSAKGKVVGARPGDQNLLSMRIGSIGRSAILEAFDPSYQSFYPRIWSIIPSLVEMFDGFGSMPRMMEIPGNPHQGSMTDRLFHQSHFWR